MGHVFLLLSSLELELIEDLRFDVFFSYVFDVFVELVEIEGRVVELQVRVVANKKVSYDDQDFPIELCVGCEDHWF